MVGFAVVVHEPPMPLRRKKWTEEEEETLIAKYGELLHSGSLSKMKSRERKFEPIAAHVNALYHARNPVAYPWQWTWKDASTKVQNMRHQYLGVKQKIRKLVVRSGEHEEEYDWEDGISHWSNFLKYKEIFGDQELDVNEFLNHSDPKLLPGRLHRPSSGASNSLHLYQQHHETSRVAGGSTAGAGSLNFHRSNNNCMPSLAKDFVDSNVGMVNQNGAMLFPSSSVKDAMPNSVLDDVVLNGGDSGDLVAAGLESYGDYDDDGDDDEYEQQHDCNNAMESSKPKRKRQWLKSSARLENSVTESRIVAFIANQFSELRERELRREKQEMEREKERESRISLLEAQIVRTRQEWEKHKNEIEELRQREAENRDVKWKEHDLKRDALEKQRWDIERERDRVRDEKMERERVEWQEKMEAQAMQHQASMMQIQLQIAQIHHNSMTMLTGALLQMAGQGNDLGGQGSSVNAFLPQFLQSLQTHSNGLVQCGLRRGNGESSDSHFDVDG